MKNVFETIEIAPAVRLCSYETDRFTTGRLSISIAVPLVKKDASLNAMVPFLLNRSCKEYPSYIELNKKLAGLYGATLSPSLSKQGDNHIMRLTMSVLGNKFALDGEDIFLECARLLFEVVFNPNILDGAFLESEVEQERRLAVERIRNELNDKRQYALTRAIEEMFADEEYSAKVNGTEKGIMAVTPKDLYDAYKKIIAGGRIQVNVTGSANVAAVADLLESYISKIDREPYMLFTSVQYEAESVKHVEEELPVNQGKLVLGFRAGMMDPDEDYPKIKVMTDLFGGGVHSRLFTVVREQMSLCYYCAARAFRNKGVIMVQSGIENENAETAITEIQNQLKYLATSVTEEDLTLSKRSLADTYKTVCDTPEDIDSWLFSEFMDDELETPLEHTAKLLAVTLDDVKQAAANVTLDTIYLLRGTEGGEE